MRLVEIASSVITNKYIFQDIKWFTLPKKPEYYARIPIFNNFMDFNRFKFVLLVLLSVVINISNYQHGLLGKRKIVILLNYLCFMSSSELRLAYDENVIKCYWSLPSTPLCSLRFIYQ